MFKLRLLLIVLFLPVLFSCNRSVKEAVPEVRTPDNTRLFAGLEPQVMFVTATGGLSIRSDTTVNSTRIGLLPFREPVTIYARSNNVETINDITDFWYSISEQNDLWVFGGYLSEEFPSYDYKSLIVGNWDMNYNHGGYERFFIQFNSNNTVLIGVRYSGHGYRGTWELDGDLITARVRGGMDYENPEQVVVYYTIADVIDQNTIIFRFPNWETVELTRSNYSY